MQQHFQRHFHSPEHYLCQMHPMCIQIDEQYPFYFLSLDLSNSEKNHWNCISSDLVWKTYAFRQKCRHYFGIGDNFIQAHLVRRKIIALDKHQTGNENALVRLFSRLFFFSLSIFLSFHFFSITPPLSPFLWQVCAPSRPVPFMRSKRVEIQWIEHDK